MASEGTPKWTLRLDPVVREQAIKRARREGRTLAEVVREFIENYAKS